MFKLSKDVRLKHDISTNNYYLFCIKTGRHVRLNSISNEIATLLELGMSIDSINEYILKNYEIDKETCSKDIKEFIKFLWDNEMVYSID